MIDRWKTIRVSRSTSGWVWSDWAGWGTGVYRTRVRALLSALRGR